ncbi:DNA-processing protein DprA [Govanella unica]|uniref:DNA-processing protein DprA n=1 Tax=Govanella unica TaxID=2975056 RepID=A0A9X3TWV5_9PROT|nr:DNA-processing protein DprA [Govania unica]MDA5193118.1 DNA-processing protein DprA [Govania unica]
MDFGAQPSAPLDRNEKFARLRLIRSENVGPITFRQLIARCGSAIAALDHIPHMARRGGLSRQIRICSTDAAETEMQAARKLGARLLFWGEADYPSGLAAVDDSPPLIYVRGHPHLLQKPMLAIVGARNASTVGRKIAGDIARDLGQAGYVVVSGLARGIDGAAHAASLATGTAAVLAGGVDVVYPREHQTLYDQILESGVHVAELPPGIEPQARHFPRRNRIISGLSRGVLVVEANLQSGSLITARCAADQGREVFAIPGSPLDARALGPNRLIRDGALLTESAADILAALQSLDNRRIREPQGHGGISAPPAALPDSLLEEAHDIVTELLGPVPAGIDDLIRESGLLPAAVLTVLLDLELAGRAERHSGNRVSRLPD